MAPHCIHQVITHSPRHVPKHHSIHHTIRAIHKRPSLKIIPCVDEAIHPEHFQQRNPWIHESRKRGNAAASRATLLQKQVRAAPLPNPSRPYYKYSAQCVPVCPRSHGQNEAVVSKPWMYGPPTEAPTRPSRPTPLLLAQATLQPLYWAVLPSVRSLLPMESRTPLTVHHGPSPESQCVRVPQNTAAFYGGLLLLLPAEHLLCHRDQRLPGEHGVLALGLRQGVDLRERGAARVNEGRRRGVMIPLNKKGRLGTK